MNACAEFANTCANQMALPPWWVLLLIFGVLVIWGVLPEEGGGV